MYIAQHFHDGGIVDDEEEEEEEANRALLAALEADDDYENDIDDDDGDNFIGKDNAESASNHEDNHSHSRSNMSEEQQSQSNMTNDSDDLELNSLFRRQLVIGQDSTDTKTSGDHRNVNDGDGVKAIRASRGRNSSRHDRGNVPPHAWSAQCNHGRLLFSTSSQT